jgi:hypothetical protein
MGIDSRGGDKLNSAQANRGSQGCAVFGATR